jgi:hypothetical protein
MLFDLSGEEEVDASYDDESAIEQGADRGAREEPF